MSSCPVAMKLLQVEEHRAVLEFHPHTQELVLNPPGKDVSGNKNITQLVGIIPGHSLLASSMGLCSPRRPLRTPSPARAGATTKAMPHRHRCFNSNYINSITVYSPIIKSSIHAASLRVQGQHLLDGGGRLLDHGNRQPP